MTAASGSDPDGYVLEEDELPAVGQGWGANRVSGREFMFEKSGGIMKRNKVSKLQMKRLAAGVTIALLAGTCQVMADQSTNPISESEVFTTDRLAQVVNKNNMPKERFKKKDSNPSQQVF